MGEAKKTPIKKKPTVKKKTTKPKPEPAKKPKLTGIFTEQGIEIG